MISSFTIHSLEKKKKRQHSKQKLRNIRGSRAVNHINKPDVSTDFHVLYGDKSFFFFSLSNPLPLSPDTRESSPKGFQSFTLGVIFFLTSMLITYAVELQERTARKLKWVRWLHVIDGSQKVETALPFDKKME